MDQKAKIKKGIRFIHMYVPIYPSMAMFNSTTITDALTTSFYIFNLSVPISMEAIYEIGNIDVLGNSQAGPNNTITKNNNCGLYDNFN